MAFFSGAEQNHSNLIPNIHYSFSPTLSLFPTTITPRRIYYEDIPAEEIIDFDCVGRLHDRWQGENIHQATPLTRLTLCARGCLADQHNTVLIGLAHTARNPHYGRYARFEAPRRMPD